MAGVVPPRSFPPEFPPADLPVSIFAVFRGLVAVCLLAATAFAAPLEFNRDIRPILSEHCFACHGPDSASRKADLRLDRRESALAEREGKRAIVPGDAAKSELVRRITSHDADERMPPAESKLVLNASEIALLRRWIDEGAKWGEHWAFVTPKRPPIPATAGSRLPLADWPRNAIDHFILAKLESKSLVPAPPADPRVLIRRVYFDLIGLPPTPKEIDDFVAECEAERRSPQASSLKPPSWSSR